jgi:DNA processing protein
VLVVEAAWASGSLITAHWAADQGRNVYALPGRVDHPMARGCHRILREGAQLIEAPEELLRELGLGVPASQAEPRAPQVDDAPDRLSKLQTRLLGALTGETLSADELGLRVELDLSEVLTALVELELMGLATRGPGGLYRRCGLDSAT